MKPEIKKLWTDALRSGEYQQAQERLRREDKFCYLGVLCDLHSKATGSKWNDTQYDGQDYSLPDSVIWWAGLMGTSPFIIQGDFSLSLAKLNDDGISFTAIADIIEQSL